MHLKTRIALALIAGFYALVVVFSIQYSLGRITALSMAGEMIRIHLSVFLTGFAAGFAGARLMGQANWPGFLIWLVTAFIATLIGAILQPILSGWPIIIRTLLDGGDTKAGLQSLASVPALGIAFVAGAVYFNGIIAVIWVLGLITSHAIARRFRL